MSIPDLDVKTIKQINFPADQYIQTVYPKNQLVIHHTASGPGVAGDLKWWLQDPRRVGTCVIIDRTGDIDQCFLSKYWAGHLNIVSAGNQVPDALKKYLTSAQNTKLDQGSIGIEIDNWGPLVFHDGAYRSWAGSSVPNSDVVSYPMSFKTLGGSGDLNAPNYFDKIGVAGKPAYFYHKYTDAQILSVAQLLKMWGKAYNIPLNYLGDMWGLCEKALSGQKGVFTHVSYRSDKSDCHPQSELIEMLKSLTV